MKTSTNKQPTLDTLLAILSTKMDTLIEKFDKMEVKLENKVDLNSFNELKLSLEKHKEDVAKKLADHTTKISIGTGIAMGISAILHFIK